MNVYLSYCPECHNILEYNNEVLSVVDGDNKNDYYIKYKNKIMLEHIKTKQ